MNMETGHIPHLNPYYYSCRKTEECIDSEDDLKNSAGFGDLDIKQEPIYEPLGDLEEPIPYSIPSTYDIPRKSSEKPALPKREIRSNTSACGNTVQSSSSIPHTIASQHEDVAGSSSSPCTSVSQYKNMPGYSSTPDGSKDKTDSSADPTNNNSQYVNTQPKNEDDASVLSADGYMPMRGIDHECDETTDGYA